MKFDIKYRYRRVPDKKLLDDIKRAAKKIKKTTLTRDEYKIHGNFSDHTVIWRFSTWNKAISAAGLEASSNKICTREELLENMIDVWIKLGRQPVCTEMKRANSRYSLSCYAKKFGSWIKSLEAFEKYLASKKRIRGKSLDEKERLKKLKARGIRYIRKQNRRVSYYLRYRVLQRDNHTCRSCGRSPANERGVKLHIDHIKPWSKGGESVYDNLQVLCEACNLGKSNTTP